MISDFIVLTTCAVGDNMAKTGRDIVSPSSSLRLLQLLRNFDLCPNTPVLFCSVVHNLSTECDIFHLEKIYCDILRDILRFEILSKYFFSSTYGYINVFQLAMQEVKKKKNSSGALDDICWQPWEVLNYRPRESRILDIIVQCVTWTGLCMNEAKNHGIYLQQWRTTKLAFVDDTYLHRLLSRNGRRLWYHLLL